MVGDSEGGCVFVGGLMVAQLGTVKTVPYKLRGRCAFIRELAVAVEDEGGMHWLVGCRLQNTERSRLFPAGDGAVCVHWEFLCGSAWRGVCALCTNVNQPSQACLQRIGNPCQPNKSPLKLPLDVFPWAASGGALLYWGVAGRGSPVCGFSLITDGLGAVVILSFCGE